MKCPYCGYSESKVIDSRPADENSSIRRRRECLSCGKRFTTYETVESLPMVVVKKDGSRQSFERRKVLGGMIRACEKRPVPLAELDAAEALFAVSHSFAESEDGAEFRANTAELLTQLRLLNEMEEISIKNIL